MRTLACAALTIVLATAAISGAVRQLTAVERLGKALFFDTSLSAGGNQSCASCHDPKAGWTGGQEQVNKGRAVYEGSISGRFGNRKPPSVAYATVVPNFRLVSAHRSVFTEFSGGNFWDGRATGAKLGSAAADQAQGPFLNPLEHALPDAATVVSKVCAGPAAVLFKQVWGARACLEPEAAFASIARSVAAYEASSEVNQYSSKWDAVLAGTAKLTPQEQHGLDLFTGKAHCSSCHPNRSVNGAPLFTNFGFQNIGVPRNPSNPFYDNAAVNPDGPRWVDRGLGGFLENTPALAQYAAAQSGKHRVPTLRNVDLRPSPAFVKAYGHNGYFKSLKSIVHFYNTRDALPPCHMPAQVEGVDCWPEPEVEANVTTVSVGDLGLTDAEEDAIVAFLATLSDGFTYR